jgi:peptidoglycan hydrolase-like protein with peptidoglycan-binding domain
MSRRAWLPKLRAVGWGAVVLVIGLAGGWALRTVLSPPADVLTAPGFTLVTAQQGTVGQALRLNTSAAWEAEAVLANQAAGIVTSVALKSGATARPGSRLYTVDLRPVVVAAGAVPAFRDLSAGVRGADVAQVQRMLAALGYRPGDPDGVFDFTLAAAVRAWQRQLGVLADGVVRRGDIVFVRSLPARLALDPAVVVGAAVSGGEPAVRVLPSVPRFTIVLPEAQGRVVAAGMRVEISPEGAGPWRAEVVAVRPSAGGPVAELGGLDGAPICGEDCTVIPFGEEALLPSVVHIVPEVSGVTVPAAAVVTDATGRTGVVLESGGFQPVTVVAGAAGMAVVTGLAVGTRVRTPGGVPA